MTKLKVITLFSGVGMQEKGLEKITEYELINYSEFVSKISDCFCILHNETKEKNLGDITKLDIEQWYNKLSKTDRKIDVIISSFPCQSFSIAGKKEGFEDKSKGNLYDEGLKLIMKIKPKIVIYENVKNITSSKFNAIEKITESMVGYKCYHKILNSIHYGIPQNRERWFMVCVRNDIHKTNFEFPEQIKLEKKVKDFVDQENTDRTCDSSMKKYFDPKYKKNYASRNELIKVFDGVSEGYFNSGFTGHRIYSIEGSSPTFTTSNDIHFYELKGRLTAKERMLLMGLTEEDYNKLKDNNISDSLIHKICGNGIVVTVFEHLFKNIYDMYLS